MLLGAVVKLGQTCSQPWLRFQEHVWSDDRLDEDDFDMISLPAIDASTLPAHIPTVGLASLAEEFNLYSLRAKLANLFDCVKAGVGTYAGHVNILAKQYAADPQF